MHQKFCAHAETNESGSSPTRRGSVKLMPIKKENQEKSTLILALGFGHRDH